MLLASLRFSVVPITAQGKLLPIPERVPFRLTADMVDGLGISGVQGVFQRCSEETLRVLRVGSDVIMTVLEVFKHDPLHSWYIFAPPRPCNPATHSDTVPTGLRAISRSRTLSIMSKQRALILFGLVSGLIWRATPRMRLQTVPSAQSAGNSINRSA